MLIKRKKDLCKRKKGPWRSIRDLFLQYYIYKEENRFSILVDISTKTSSDIVLGKLMLGIGENTISWSYLDEITKMKIGSAL